MHSSAVERRIADPEVAGSIPVAPFPSRLAQLVERKTLNLVVVGSSPTVGVPFLFFGILIFFKKKIKKSFPHRESNPGRVGENHIS